MRPHSTFAEFLFMLALFGFLLIADYGVAQKTESNSAPGDPLVGTQPLTMQGEIATHMVEGADRFLLREITTSVELRPKFWKRDSSSAAAWNTSVAPNRQTFAWITGVRDPRPDFDEIELVTTLN